MSNNEIEAPNFQAIFDWADRHRPDIVKSLRSLAGQSDQAHSFLMAVCFSAGRYYQSNNPELDVISYPVRGARS